MSNSLWPHGLEPLRLLHPRDIPGKNSGVGCPFLLQGIFPTQGSNLGLPHCRRTPYRLSHQGSHCKSNILQLKKQFPKKKKKFPKNKIKKHFLMVGMWNQASLVCLQLHRTSYRESWVWFSSICCNWVKPNYYSHHRNLNRNQEPEKSKSPTGESTLTYLHVRDVL